MVSNPAEEAEYVELTIQPIPPDTVSSAKAEILPIIKAALHEAEQEHLLACGEFQVEVEKTFPTDEAIIVGLTLLSGIALETYKAIVLPRLRKRFRVREKRRQKGKDEK